MSDAKEDFFKSYGTQGHNFMTPNPLRYGRQGCFVYELSFGEGLDGKGLYGVTVVDSERQIRRHDLSQCFKTQGEANAYIKKLKRLQPPPNNTPSLGEEQAMRSFGIK